MKKYLLLFLLLPLVSSAATTLFPIGGGTGTSSVNASDVGKYLKISDDSPFTYTFDTPTAGGGSFPFTSASYGVSTSTIVGFLAGMFSVGSSTIQDLHATYASTSQLSVTGSATTTIAGGASAGIKFTSDGSCIVGPNDSIVHICFDEAAGLRVGYSNLSAMTHTTYTAAAIQTFVADAEIGRWNATGLGIMTTNPTTALDVQGTASTTHARIAGTLTIPLLTSSGLGVNASGQVYAAATTTFTGSTGLTYANGNVTCDVATGSVPGCLSAANWTTFNGKEGSLGTINGLVASNGTTRYQAASSTLYASLGTLGALGLDSTGAVYKFATTTFSGGLSYAAGNVTDVLTAGDHLTRTTNDFDVDDDFILNTGDVGTGSYTFPQVAFTNATGTSIYASASSTIQDLHVDTLAVEDVTFSGFTDFTDSTVTIEIPFSFYYSTTTWVGTTTKELAPASSAQTWKSVMCHAPTGTVNVVLGDNTNDMNLFNASSTVGEVNLTTNNTLNKFISFVLSPKTTFT